jgi:hypothetical protein
MTKETGINPQILITKYMIERLLERLSVSKYKDRFILKRWYVDIFYNRIRSKINNGC